MKFTLGWLREHLETDASLGDIAEKLTAIGLEVEGISDRAETYAPFRVARIESAEKHPDADRLKVCIVDTGTEKLQVVCGAPNARAGMKGVFAPAGSVVPATGTVLKKGVIRGVESNGMMVSEAEMALSSESEGIIEIADDVALGTPMATLFGLDDPLIEINLTPNRADCAGVRGIARDLAAAGLGRLKPLDESAVRGAFPAQTKVTIEPSAACPLFVGRTIRGVKNGPSPAWLQTRLKSIGLRPISALVDITNYLTFDLCRPLHVYDAGKLRGDIVVRGAKDGESLAALDGKSYALASGMTAICDGSGVLGLGGIIGGETTGCDENTTDVFLECAYFDPLTIARTGRALGIGSDARYRFERGVDPAFTLIGVEIATRLILSLCGGEAGEIVTAGAAPPRAEPIAFDPAFTGKMTGLEIPAAEQKKILEALGFSVAESGGGTWTVQQPAWRGDIDGRQDLVEEVARIYGFDAVPSAPVRLPEGSVFGHEPETRRLSRARRARTALVGRGMNECVTWSFMPGALADRFGGRDHQTAQALTLSNPISAELDRMRPTPLANLILAAGRNRDRGFADVALFEAGPAFAGVKPGDQSLVAAGVRAGANGARHWSGAEASRPADAFDVKADVLAVLESCGVATENLQVSRDAPDWYHPGRSGSLRLGPNVLAHFGEVHPGLAGDMGIKGALAGFEIFLDRLPEARRKGTAKPALALSAFQPVNRDFAFTLDVKTEADALVKAIRAADKKLVQSVGIFDVYTGKGVEEGKKSVAVSVTIQPEDRTLTDAEIESLSKKIVEQVAAKAGGVLRG